MDRELGTDPPALTNTAAHEAWLKRSDAIPLRIPPPEPTQGTFQAILNRTRACYGRERA